MGLKTVNHFQETTQLEDEQLRARLYAKIIEITEKDLNISITKKNCRQAVKNLHAENTKAQSVGNLCELLGGTHLRLYGADNVWAGVQRCWNGQIKSLRSDDKSGV